ncbi:hypothetical protein BaRGS_00007762 [Batillaria attramentaria]|uniref:Apple domain-containing protein n=1 Tax=Batillaria attramentaria TaxID=370345 RepID=A0ABD0LMS4_9CAEN
MRLICLFAACDETDLQQNYMRYAVSGLVGYNIAAYTPRTLEECQQLCSNDTACRTFEYMDQLGQCVLQAVTPMDTPWAWNRGNDLGWDLYQRMCA